MNPLLFSFGPGVFGFDLEKNLIFGITTLGIWRFMLIRIYLDMIRGSWTIFLFAPFGYTLSLLRQVGKVFHRLHFFV